MALNDDAHVEVEATWLICQRIVAAYRDPDRPAGMTALPVLIDELRAGVPKPLKER